MIAQGGLCAFPTETVFGLGADATDPGAVSRIFEMKGRPADNPLIVHIASVKDWSLAAQELTESASKLLDAFAPGPITVVVPRSPDLCEAVSAGLETVALRIPSCEIARSVLQQAGIPVAAPSANRSGRPSGTTWESVLEDLDGRIDAVLCQNSGEHGLESTVVDCTGKNPVLLRPGAVSLDDLRKVIPSATVHSQVPTSVAGRSPGLKHPHYQPSAQVILIQFSEVAGVQLAVPQATGHSAQLPTQLPTQLTNVAYCGLQPHSSHESLAMHRQFRDVKEYAREFYEFLRSADRCKVDTILCQYPGPEGIGSALQDRLQRAAGHK